MGPLGAAAEKALPALLDALGDKDGDVRHFAGEAISKAAGKAVPGLARDLLSGVPATLNRAAHAVKKIGPSAAKAVPALIAALADPDADPDVRWTATHALGAIGPTAGAGRPRPKPSGTRTPTSAKEPGSPSTRSRRPGERAAQGFSSAPAKTRFGFTRAGERLVRPGGVP